MTERDNYVTKLFNAILAEHKCTYGDAIGILEEQLKGQGYEVELEKLNDWLAS